MGGEQGRRFLWTHSREAGNPIRGIAGQRLEVHQLVRFNAQVGADPGRVRPGWAVGARAIEDGAQGGQLQKVGIAGEHRHQAPMPYTLGGQ